MYWVNLLQCITSFSLHSTSSGLSESLISTSNCIDFLRTEIKPFSGTHNTQYPKTQSNVLWSLSSRFSLELSVSLQTIPFKPRLRISTVPTMYTFLLSKTSSSCGNQQSTKEFVCLPYARFSALCVVEKKWKLECHSCNWACAYNMIKISTSYH